MANNSDDEDSTVTHWDRCLSLLSAQPRRNIVLSLMETPPQQRVSLPDAALTADRSEKRDGFILELEHDHLPKLANVDYIRWERDPFCARRGTRFEEPAGMMRVLLSSKNKLPPSLQPEFLDNN